MFNFGKPASSSVGGAGTGVGTGSAPSSGFSFGNTATKPAATGGLFGGAGAGTTGGLFGSKPAAGGPTSSLFGNTQSNPQTNNNTQSLYSGLQQLNVPQQQQSSFSQISQLPVTPMTRIIDLPPQLRQEVEQLDQYIQKQVQISQHLRADTQEHLELIASIPRDISYLMKNQSMTNQSLSNDLKKISAIKQLTDENTASSQNFSLILQQLLTPGSKISAMELDKFFQAKIQMFKSKLDDFATVLADIESAMNGINSDVFGSGTTSSTAGKITTTNTAGAITGPATTVTPTGKRDQDRTNDVFVLKTGLNAIVSTVIEEFSLFMDTAQRIAELHQKIKQLSV
ncbi:FG-nucleoporin NUP49 KNAG_0G01180 [Huiozyma naganishii CBS 8797]|uniref:Nucleoporin Nup54 alpha-helical domain-containing protein n=1 Tax=Huiozyma naganishii (strain ATCC MYA-139 / BCRC 22969 / CBS 8797 / KCTC 17520 / NBRC 10181 / NCYC 3082 / Yp74L-3) TaxID=1071383 RepID=J7S8Y2_HUIN7|nr:hypothetical protein KNAG_0G01180 [Kazachstania naganishii CBS 8797]CCK71176.1 hypothetical protein KNAG_0G01180 [Kazachstania naganishii CBS 8797]